MAFVEDILLKANSLSHQGDLITEDEELTPSLENFVVLTYMVETHSPRASQVSQAEVWDQATFEDVSIH